MNLLGRMIALTTITAALLSTSPSATAAPFSRLYSFGDSLVDTGIISSLTFGIVPGPNYFSGRFSNGPVYSERVATALGIPLTNFGVGGAFTNNQNVGSALLPTLPGLAQQFPSFQAAVPGGDPQGLYLINVASNDYAQAGQTNPAIPVANIENFIINLTSTGARQFVVSNVVDLSRVPGSAGVPGIQATVQEHNALLTSALTMLETSLGINIYQADAYQTLNTILADPAAFGFTDVATPYLPSAIGDVNSFLFFDDFHPTARGQQLFADAVLAVVPEPGTMSLVILSATILLPRRRPAIVR